MPYPDVIADDIQKIFKGSLLKALIALAVRYPRMKYSAKCTILSAMEKPRPGVERSGIDDTANTKTAQTMAGR